MNTQEKIKKQINEMSDQLAVLEAKAEKAKADVKLKYKEKLASLRAKRNDMKEKYDDLAGAADEKWEEAKETFSSASKSFKEGFNELKSLF